MPDAGIKILIVFACFTFLTAIPSIIQVASSLLSCLLRWKECVNMHSSVSLGRRRNAGALAVIPAFILLCAQYRLVPWTESLGIWPALGYTLLTFVAYAMVRYLCRILFRGRSIRATDFAAAVETVYIFFLLAGIVMALTFCVCSVCGLPDSTVTKAFRVEIIFLYALFVLRKTQILSHYGGIFSGILYLCTLECLPTGLLTASMLLI